MPRKIPTPFKRPSINLEDTGRVWHHIPARQVRVGDIVADLGLVGEVVHTTGYDTFVDIHNRFGDTKRFTPDETVFAFVLYSSLAG